MSNPNPHNQFQPGDAWRGNANGRPKRGESLTDILRKLAEARDVSKGEELVDRKQALAEVLWRKALDGDFSAVKYVYDRLDGMPRERIEQEGETIVKVVWNDGNVDKTAEAEGVPGE